MKHREIEIVRDGDEIVFKQSYHEIRISVDQVASIAYCLSAYGEQATAEHE